MVLFADDTNILVIDKNYTALQEKTNRVMEQLETWFLYNNIAINTEKTQVMLFKGKCPSSATSSF
jgi:predicted ATP-grasp superfamily ATP-dependent carboligase